MTSNGSRDATERLTDLAHLSAGVGHHVINAFSAIVSNAEILRYTSGEPGSTDPLELADTIIRASVEASAVARRLIDVTRAITTVGPTPILLHDLVASVVADERPRERPGVAWRTQLAVVPPIQGHEPQLVAMLGHLIANAREAMPPGGGTISLSTFLDGRGWVVLEVRDTGVGMNTETRRRAVEPFFTTKSGRFGVGLTIANGIWRRHRGTLALQSESGSGTTLRLLIDPTNEPYLPRITKLK